MTRSTQPNFDPLARHYQWLEYLTLGPLLERCRQRFLPRLLHHPKALILGDGDGRFLATLSARNPALQADAVDTSAAMLHLQRKRSEASAPLTHSRLQTHQTDALTFAAQLPQTQTYDLVATHFFLDCLTQHDLEALITRLTPHLAPGALWVISDFRIPSGPMRLPALIIVRGLYLAFRIITNLRTTRLPDHHTPLAKSGLTRIAHHHSLAGLLTTELWQFPATPAK
jgi:SAM-dependent methyltransferase